MPTILERLRALDPNLDLRPGSPVRTLVEASAEVIGEHLDRIPPTPPTLHIIDPPYTLAEGPRIAPISPGLLNELRELARDTPPLHIPSFRRETEEDRFAERRMYDHDWGDALLYATQYLGEPVREVREPRLNLLRRRETREEPVFTMLREREQREASSRSIGWTMHENIGVGVVNTRAMDRIRIPEFEIVANPTIHFDELGSRHGLRRPDHPIILALIAHRQAQQALKQGEPPTFETRPPPGPPKSTWEWLLGDDLYA